MLPKTRCLRLPNWANPLKFHPIMMIYAIILLLMLPSLYDWYSKAIAPNYCRLELRESKFKGIDCGVKTTYLLVLPLITLSGTKRDGEFPEK